VQKGISCWKLDGSLRQCFRAQAAQRRVIVQHIDAATESSNHQVILLLLNGEIADGDRGQSALEADPVLAAVYRDVQPKLRAGKEQVRVLVILGKSEYRTVSRQVASNGNPGLACVDALLDIGNKIGVLVIIERCIHGLFFMLRRKQPADIGSI